MSSRQAPMRSLSGNEVNGLLSSISGQCDPTSVPDAIEGPLAGFFFFSGGPRDVEPPYHSVVHHFVVFMDTLKAHIAAVEELEVQYERIMDLNRQALQITELQKQAGEHVGPAEHITTGGSPEGEAAMKDLAISLYIGINRASCVWYKRLEQMWNLYMHELEKVMTPEEFSNKVPLRLKLELEDTAHRVDDLLLRVRQARGCPGLWF